MQKKNILLSLICMLIIAAAIGFAAFRSSARPYGDRASKLVSEIREMDSSVIAVRPSRVTEPSLGRFKVQWKPSVTIRKGTSLEDQERLAVKLARYVVDFQGGVRTSGVKGGIIAFLEGEGWYPKLGNVSYKIVKRDPLTIEVWTNYQKPNEHGTATCCDPGRQIGMIQNDEFFPFK